MSLRNWSWTGTAEKIFIPSCCYILLWMTGGIRVWRSCLIVNAGFRPFTVGCTCFWWTPVTKISCATIFLCSLRARSLDDAQAVAILWTCWQLVCVESASAQACHPLILTLSFCDFSPARNASDSTTARSDSSDYGSYSDGSASNASAGVACYAGTRLRWMAIKVFCCWHC